MQASVHKPKCCCNKTVCKVQELESIVDVKALSIGRPCEPRKGLPNFIHNVRTFPVVGRVMTVCTTETGRDETQNKGHLVNQVQQKSGRLGVPSPRSKAGCSRYSSHDTNMGSAPKAAYGQSPRWIRSRARQDRMVFQILAGDPGNASPCSHQGKGCQAES